MSHIISHRLRTMGRWVLGRRLLLNVFAAAIIVLAAMLPLIETVSAFVEDWVEYSTVHEGEQTANYVPSDAKLYVSFNLRPGLDQLQAFDDFITNLSAEDAARKSEAELWQMIKEMMDVDGNIPESSYQDLFPNLGPEIAIAQWNTSEEVDPDLVKTLVFIGTKSRTVTDPVFDEFKALREDSGVIFISPGYSGVETYESMANDEFYALTDDYILFCNKQDLMYQVIDTMQGSGGASLYDDPDFQAARSALTSPRMGMVYVDTDAYWEEMKAADVYNTFEQARNDEKWQVEWAVRNMIDDNYLPWLIPNPVSSATATNDMSQFPDIISDDDTNAGKVTDPDGYDYTIAAGSDLPGYVLYGHDKTGNNSATPVVDYIGSQTTTYWYTIDGYASYYYEVGMDLIHQYDGPDPATATENGLIIDPEYTSPLEAFDNVIPSYAAASISFADSNLNLDLYVPVPEEINLGSTQSNPASSAGLVPDDAVAFLSTQNPAGFWQDIVNFRDAHIGEEWAQGFADAVTSLNTDLGIDLDNDIFSWMDGEVSFAVLTPGDLQIGGDSVMLEPDYVLMAEVANQEAVANTLNDLVLNPPEAYTPGSISQVDIYGVEANMVNLPGSAGGEFTPGYLFLNGYLVIGSSYDALESVIATYTGGLATLDETTGYQNITSSLPYGSSLIGYLDIHTCVDIFLTEAPGLMGPKGWEEFQQGFQYISPFLWRLEALGASASIEATPGGMALRGSVVLGVIDGPVAPKANFGAEPKTGTYPLTVQFTDRSLGTVDSWLWDFGDGTSSSDQDPSHPYAEVGTYDVSLIVTGPAGSNQVIKADYVVVSPWTTPVDISGSMYGTEEPDIAVDASGNAHVVWQGYDPYYGYNIFYATYDGTSWSEPLNISGSSEGCYNPGIAADSSGNVHVVWQEYDYDTYWNDNIFYTTYNGTSWSEPLNISESDGGCYAPDITVDSSGNVHVVWQEYDYDTYWNDNIFHATYNGTSWSEPLNISGSYEGCYAPGVAADASGNLNVVWQEYVSDPYWSNNIFHATYNGTSWSEPLNISGSYESCYAPDIDADADGNIHVVWYGYLDDYSYCDVFYTINTDGSWSDPENVSLSWDDSYRPAIAAGSAHVVWKENGQILYSSKYIDSEAPGIPDLLSPADGSDSETSTPTLDWSDVTDPSGVSYCLKVDNDSDFSSPVLSRQGLSSSEYTLRTEEALTEGEYYWRVKAIDGADNESAWSESRHFTALQGSPVISEISPDSGTQGETLSVTILGGDLAGATDVSFGTGISVEITECTNTMITVDITIEAEATISTRDVSVTTPVDTDVVEDGFTIIGTGVLTQQTISPDSQATVKTEDNSIVIEFPEGSVDTDTVVTIREQSPDDLPDCPTGFKAGSTFFSVELTGDLDPGTKVIITMKYTNDDLEACDGDTSRLTLARYDEATGKWVIVDTTVDTEAMTLSAETEQFSKWMIMIMDSVDEGGTSLWVYLGPILGVLAVLVIAGVIIIKRRRSSGGEVAA